MQNLFDLLPEVHQGISKFPEWRYVRDGLRRNLEAVLAFARKNPMAVPSQHFLVRLLHSLNVPLSHNLERYYDLIDAGALHVSMPLKMTSAINQGALFKGVFYGGENLEVIIAHNAGFSLDEAMANWESLQPIQVLRHPHSDLGLPILDGVKNYGSETGFAVIVINIPMLAVQYRAFRLNEDRYTDFSQGSERSVQQFVRMYAIPNMLYSHLDVALFNRIDHLQQGQACGESSYRHPFYLTDFSVRSDQAQLDMLERIQAVGRNWTGMLRTIPAVTQENMDDLLRVPDIVPTRQVLWALVIARTNALAFMFRASKEGSRTTNANEVNRLRRALTAWRTDSLMRNALPTKVLAQVMQEIDDIEQKAEE
jgi:hypothetical protein